MEYSGLRAPIDITKSVKLEQYYNSQNLSAEDNKFVNEIDISKLFDNDTYNSIKYKTDTYNKIKTAIANGEIPTEQVAAEMESLRSDVLYESNGQDIEKIDFKTLHSAERLDTILRDYGVSSKNDMRVRLVDSEENWVDNSEFKRVEVVSSNAPYAWGILPSAKLLVLDNGTIIVKTNSLYRK